MENSLICTFFNVIDTIKAPLAIGAVAFIGLSKIASAFFPEAGQRAQQSLKMVIVGMLLLVGATWIVGLLFQGASTGCP